MKLFKITLILIIVGLSKSSFAISEDTTLNNCKRDVLVHASARVFGGSVYFNLSMLNESKPGVYSLVKVFNDNSFESVGIKEITVNQINQPLGYSFVDRCTGKAPASYKLIRISFETEVVKTWYCSDIDGNLCLDATDLANQENTKQTPYENKTD